MQALGAFDWTRTREVVLTVDPKKFPTGQEAYEHVTRNKLIHGLIRNLERGKRVQNPETGQWDIGYTALTIHHWKWFLEWHAGGFPHWHLFIEVDEQGKAGMIGGERLRHYWGSGRWVYESYIKSPSHWKEVTGYFSKRGYFEVKGKHSRYKEHQMTLPDWALEAYGNPKKIRRSCASVDKDRPREIYDEETNTLQTKSGCILDPRTGEVFVMGKPKKKPQNQEKPEPISYKAILKKCGEKTKVKVWTPDTYALFITARPYAEVREKIKGEYVKGVGYTFSMDRAGLDWLADAIVRVIDFKGRKQKRDEHSRKMERHHERWAERGYWDYRSHFG